MLHAPARRHRRPTPHPARPEASSSTRGVELGLHAGELLLGAREALGGGGHVGEHAVEARLRDDRGVVVFGGLHHAGLRAELIERALGVDELRGERCVLGAQRGHDRGVDRGRGGGLGVRRSGRVTLARDRSRARPRRRGS